MNVYVIITFCHDIYHNFDINFEFVFISLFCVNNNRVKVNVSEIDRTCLLPFPCLYGLFFFIAEFFCGDLDRLLVCDEFVTLLLNPTSSK